MSCPVPQRDPRLQTAWGLSRGLSVFEIQSLQLPCYGLNKREIWYRFQGSATHFFFFLLWAFRGVKLSPQVHVVLGSRMAWAVPPSTYAVMWVNYSVCVWGGFSVRSALKRSETCFLGAFTKLRKVTVGFVMSLHLSACSNSDPTGRILMKFDIRGFFFRNSVEKSSSFITIWK